MRYDVAIVGGGFAGSILARGLAAAGRRVVLVERARHPRFALGESTTPLANLALERLAGRPGLGDLFDFSSHGRWLAAHPALRRGLKRGFTFRAHRPHQSWSPERSRRLLVAASPHDALADTHWLRADVDHHLLRRAAAAGVDVRQATHLRAVEIDDRRARLVVANRAVAESGAGGPTERLDAGLVIDAAGGSVARRLGVPERDGPVATTLFATHLAGVPERSALDGPSGRARAIDGAPYPEERAAVHDLVDWGWVYQLPFDPTGDLAAGRLRSVGLLVRHAALERLGVSRDSLGTATADVESIVTKCLAPYPMLARQLGGGRPVRPWLVAPRVGRRLARAAGERWLALPSAYAFADPMFSTGIAWSLVAVDRLLERLRADGSVDGGDWSAELEREADQVDDLVALAYRAMGDDPAARFDAFAAVASLYFVGAAYGELLERLEAGGVEGVEAAPYGFLGAHDPVIASTKQFLTEALSRGRLDGPSFRRAVAERLAPRDVVGLDRSLDRDSPTDPDLLPVDLPLALERADRLGVAPEQLDAVLPPIPDPSIPASTIPET